MATVSNNVKRMDRFKHILTLEHPLSEQSFVFAEPDAVGLVGNADVNMISTNEANMVNGPLNIMAFPQDIRIGGLWTLNPILISTIPSTMATPVPTLVFTNPGMEFMKDISSTLSVTASFIA